MPVYWCSGSDCRGEGGASRRIFLGRRPSAICCWMLGLFRLDGGGDVSRVGLVFLVRSSGVLVGASLAALDGGKLGSMPMATSDWWLPKEVLELEDKARSSASRFSSLAASCRVLELGLMLLPSLSELRVLVEAAAAGRRGACDDFMGKGSFTTCLASNGGFHVLGGRLLSRGWKIFVTVAA